MKNINILFENNFHDADIFLIQIQNDKELLIELIIDYYDWDNNHFLYNFKYSKIEDYNIKLNNDGQYKPEIDNLTIQKNKNYYEQNIDLHGGGSIYIKFKNVKIAHVTKK